MTEYSKNGYGGIIMTRRNDIVVNQLDKYYRHYHYYIDECVVNKRYEDVLTDIDELRVCLYNYDCITRINILDNIVYVDGIKETKSTELILVVVELDIIRTVRLLLMGVVVRHGSTVYDLIKKYQLNTYYTRRYVLQKYDFKTYELIDELDTAFMYFCHYFDKITTVRQEVKELKQRDMVQKRIQADIREKITKTQSLERIVKREANTVDDVIGVIRELNVWSENSNTKKNTFDFLSVRVQVLERGRTKKESLELIKKFKSEIDSRVLDYIKNSKKFTRYGIPVNFLQSYDITFTSGWELEYKFQLKRIDDKKESDV